MGETVIPTTPPVTCLDTPAMVQASTFYVGDPLHPGIFVYREHRIILRSDLCHALTTISAGSAEVAGYAVYVYAHELEHAVGVTDESEADCGAARSYQAVAALVGATWRRTVEMLRASLWLDGYSPEAFFACLSVWPYGNAR